MKRVILDTDVGTDVDDALALALAAASPELRIEAVTTVHGDAQVRARIAARLLALAGRPEIPVVAGASVPLATPTPPNFHWHARLWGHEGLGLLTAAEREPSVNLEATADDAARLIVERAAIDPGTLSLIAIGPLTNVARALRREPRLAGWVADLTLMGGMVDAGRVPWPPVLETNLNADPEAAAIVFASGVPITMVPFEVTTQVALSPAQRATMRDWDSPLGTALAALMEQMLESFEGFSAEMNLPRDIFEGHTYMHDPLAIYAAMASQHVTMRRMHVALEIHDRVLRTIAYPDRTPNVRVCVDVDVPALVGFWLERVRGLAGGR